MDFILQSLPCVTHLYYPFLSLIDAFPVAMRFRRGTKRTGCLKENLPLAKEKMRYRSNIRQTLAAYADNTLRRGSCQPKS
jgi:hypothetical protein